MASQLFRTEKKINVLSFDGGGSRGVMEVEILDSIMCLATLIQREPEKLLKMDLNFEKSENRKDLANLLKEVKDPIHPTETFDMIVGN